jgi:hypothetical protein
MIKASQMERGTSMEASTKEIMLALGEILGKDTLMVSDLLNDPAPNIFGGISAGDHNSKKEIEVLNQEIARLN